MRGIPLLFAALAVTALAACGSSGSTTGEASPTTPSTTTTTTADGSGSSTTSSAAVVKTASNAKFGTILVDNDGKTLYTLTKDGAPVECTGPCLTAWPPLVLPAGTSTATGAAGVKGVGTVATPSGIQATVDGAPLYRFAADTAAGKANGDGISSFGGVWHVVKADDASGVGSTDGTTETTHADTTTTADGYGY